jgi:hypothetical protein
MPTERQLVLVGGPAVLRTITKLSAMVLIPSKASSSWPDLEKAHQNFDEVFHRLASQTDIMVQEAILVRLAAIQEELRNLAIGRIVFSATEGWRTMYDQILKSPGITHYRSIAWIQSEDYWQDSPGRRSMEANYECLLGGICIERLLILHDYFWPQAAVVPAPDIRHWIDEQHKRGIVIWLVRESSITAEPDLLCDIGIYGTRAIGTLELDSQCHTTRFTFDFSPGGIRLAEERWSRALLYATKYSAIVADNPPNK